MRNGKLPNSIARSLPTDPIQWNHAPDGLTEADIDALIAEVDAEVTPARPRPGWLSADPAERRRQRHLTRQAARLLASNWLAGGITGQGKTVTAEVAATSENEEAA